MTKAYVVFNREYAWFNDDINGIDTIQRVFSSKEKAVIFLKDCWKSWVIEMGHDDDDEGDVDVDLALIEKENPFDIDKLVQLSIGERTDWPDIFDDDEPPHSFILEEIEIEN